MQIAENHTQAELRKSENRLNHATNLRMGVPALAILRSTVMSCLTVQQDKRKSQHFVAGNNEANGALKEENRPPERLICRDMESWHRGKRRAS
jgi:hypothetical protein